LSHDQIATVSVNGGPHAEVPVSELVELRIDFQPGDWTVRCRWCRNPISYYTDGWRGNADNGESCWGEDGDGTLRPHTPVQAPLEWCQRALVTPDTPGDSITARIDLKGAAFCLTVRQHPDGTLTLHLPHPDHASAVTLTEQAPGVYQIHE